MPSQLGVRRAPSVRRRTLHVIAIACGTIAAAVACYFLYHFYFQPTVPAATDLTKADSAFNDNDLDSALNQVNAILVTNPNNIDALILKSNILAQEGSLTFQEAKYGTQAAAVAEQAIALDPNNSEAYRALGYADEIQQDYTDALTAYTKAIALDPTNALGLFDKAHVYDLQGSTTPAEAGYEAALAISPHLDAALLGLGRIYNIEGSSTEAIAEFELTYNFTTNVHTKSEAAYSLGELYLAPGNLALASTYMQQATVFDPTYPSAWQGLASVEFAEASASTTPAADRGQLFIDSLNNLVKATTLNPKQTLAYVQSAYEFLSIGNKQGALAMCARAAAALPVDITLTATEKTQLAAQIADLHTRAETLQ